MKLGRPRGQTRDRQRPRERALPRYAARHPCRGNRRQGHGADAPRAECGKKLRIAAAVLTAPAEFEPDESPDGSPWVLFGEEYPTNPRLLLGDADWEALRPIIRLWRYAAEGVLPDAGGLNDQCAALFDAFALLSATEVSLKRAKGS